MTNVDTTIDTMAVGLAFLALSFLVLAVDSPGVVPWTAAAGMALVFSVLSFTAFGLLYHQMDGLFAEADDAIANLNAIQSVPGHHCAKNAGYFVDLLLTPRVVGILDLAKPALDHRAGLFATFGGSLGITTLLMAWGLVRSPSKDSLFALARAACTKLLIGFVVLLMLSTLAEGFYSYKHTYASDIHEFQKAVECCASPNPELDCLLGAINHTAVLSEPEYGWDTWCNSSADTTVVQRIERSACCIHSAINATCALSHSVHSLWDYDEKLTQRYTQLTLLSTAIAGGLASLLLGHSRPLHADRKLGLRDAVVFFFLFWGLVGLSTAIWQSIAGDTYLLWLLWLSPWLPFAVAAAVWAYTPSEKDFGFSKITNLAESIL